MSNYSERVPGNKYRINCPVTKREDQLYVVCAMRKERVWKGEAIAERDCVCAMKASKCPFLEMQKMDWKKPGSFVSKEDKTSDIPEEVKERINKLWILKVWADEAGLTQAEFENMQTEAVVEKVQPKKRTQAQKKKESSPIDATNADILSVADTVSSLL